jgi:hypothetical protein
MARTIFYSWQSDNPETRKIIRNALNTAIKSLGRDADIAEPDRELMIDQDTQGIPGSPPVADTILRKIREADIFVADLTLINSPCAEEHRVTPNPNVMLEYGYALNALGDGYIIAVLNEAHGKAKELPFDLAYRRWPIQFNIDPNATAELKSETKDSLSASLAAAIKAILAQQKPTLPAPSDPFPEATLGDGVGRLRRTDDFLCIGSSSNDKPTWLRAAPYSFLRLIPNKPIKRLTNVEAHNIAQRYLRTMETELGVSESYGRHETGVVVYWGRSNDPNIAWSASELFLTGELLANSTFNMAPEEKKRVEELGFSFIPTSRFEHTFVAALANFIRIAKNELGLTLPLRLVAGVVGIHGFRLALNPEYTSGYTEYRGPILAQSVIEEAVIDDWNSDPANYLAPFFKSVFDSAGTTRPDVKVLSIR